MISRLHYISQGPNHLLNISRVLAAGCEWIQLRLKDGSPEDIRNVALGAANLCRSWEATFILNDYPEIAKAVNADGVHLGLSDMPVAEARKILGPGKIVGGTANTWEDVERRIQEGVDYIGLGPFKFTATKENLSPVLGLEGYQKIIQKLSDYDAEHIPPIIAIGGIMEPDIPALLETGVHGIAASTMLTNSDRRKAIIQSLNE